MKKGKATKQKGAYNYNIIHINIFDFLDELTTKMFHTDKYM